MTTINLDPSGTLTVANGDTLVATVTDSSSQRAVFLGNVAGSTGVLTVTGAGSKLVSDGRIGVGASGHGELYVLAGASVVVTIPPFPDNSSVFAGASYGGSGLIVVSGPGSLLDANNGQLALAAPGGVGTLVTSGTLVVSNGGTVLAGNGDTSDPSGLLVGYRYKDNTGPIVATGTVMIDGAGSLLNVTGIASFGRSANAVLVMSNNASAVLGAVPGGVNGGVVFARDAGTVATGTLGSGAMLSSSGHVTIGSVGSASVSLSGGAQLIGRLSTADRAAGQNGLTIGELAGGSGTLMVDGAGSIADFDAVVVVGRAGGGTLEVGSGGRVVATNALSTQNALVVGSRAGGDGHLTINAGGTVEVLAAPAGGYFSISIANEAATSTLAAASGTVLVSGVGALLNGNGNFLNIGENGGNGSLMVANGGSVTVGTPDSSLSNAVRLGRVGTGTITVADAGSVFTAHGYSAIGRGGSGTLIVRDGGLYQALDAPAGGGGIGIGSGSTGSSTYIGGSGHATITAGGVLHSSSFVNVGGNGVSGTLDVDNSGTVEAATFSFATAATIGGTLYSSNAVVRIGAGGVLRATGAHVQGNGSVFIGSGIGSTATVDVAGAGALIDSGGDTLFIGTSGTGTLSVRQGGTVLAGTQFATDSAASFGTQATGSGTLLVTDAGSTFRAVGQLNVGSGSTGHLTVSAGGTVETGNYADGLQGFTLGRAAGSSGDALVTGAGSVLRDNGVFQVGRSGAGTLTVSAGGSVSNILGAAGIAASVIGGIIGRDAGSTGQVTVTGAGSSLVISADLQVGMAGTGTLSVSDSGLVRVGTILSLGQANTGTATVNIDATGMIEVGGTGAGLAGTLRINAGALLIGQGIVNGGVRNDGAIVATGGALHFGAITGAGTIGIEAGATLDLGSLAAGTVTFNGAGMLRIGSPGAFAGAIVVGAQGGTIDLVGVSVTGSSLSGGLLNLVTTTGTLTFAVSGAFAVSSADDTASGTNVMLTGAAPCFHHGTRLLTPDGDIRVEDVRPGDLVLTATGRSASVSWVGDRKVALRRHPRPQDVMPIRVAANAFGPGQPFRDLLLSPDHAVFMDGVLIPVRYLLNGVSVATAPAHEAHYFHVELDRHDVILAEGLPCESYLDTGNRSAFDHGGPAMQLHPDFARKVWATGACAELVLDGPVLEAVRSHLLARILDDGHEMTAEADLHLLVDGRRLDAISRQGRRLEFVLPGNTTDLRLISRSAVPAEIYADTDDRRLLGVAVTHLEVDNVAMPLGSPGAGSGWHAAEAGWCWTTGSAELPFDQGCLVAVETAPLMLYRVSDAGKPSLHAAA
jgi:T5SS/PEP-CTERM-associated repeat protein